MSQSQTSPSPQPENSFFHTQTSWKINIDVNGDAQHHLIIKVLNPEFRPPIPHLSFTLPQSSTYKDFLTTVGNRAQNPGMGYVAEKKMYYFPISEILENQTSFDIDISFVQQGAFIKVGNMSLALWPFEMNLKGSIEMVIQLPNLRWYQRVAAWIQRVLERKEPFYIIHPLNIPPVWIAPRNTDYRKGTITYVLEDGTVSPGFAFEGYSRITLFAAIAGFAGLVYSIILLLAEIIP